MKEKAVVPHKSVLVDEVLHYLAVQPGKTYLDVTFGAGGHTRAILQAEPDCNVIALDWDQKSLDTYGVALQEEFGDRLTLIWGNFALLYKIAKENRIKSVDGILADFGTSQMQLGERAGFSFYKDSPLDMRMSPAHQKVTAAELLNKATQQKLEEIFWTLGQEKFARQITQAIIAQRAQAEFKTTLQLAQLVEKIVPTGSRRVHPATKVFQALRIYINKELENITSFLAAALSLLSPGGNLVCISFHSLEDGLVKHFFKEKAQEGKLNILTPKVVQASEAELKRNPSSRSACLRACQKV